MIRIAIGILLDIGVVRSLGDLNAKVPNGYILDIEGLRASDAEAIKAFLIRTFSIFVMLEGKFVEIVLEVIFDAIFVINITRFYLEYHQKIKYDIMNYAEDTYGEMDTGILCFGGFGEVTDLHVDYILMEEEMAQGFIKQVEEKGKTSGIWTVNTKNGMINAFDSGTDTIITDDIILYNDINKEMKNRTDFEILKDWCIEMMK